MPLVINGGNRAVDLGLVYTRGKQEAASVDTGTQGAAPLPPQLDVADIVWVSDVIGAPVNDESDRMASSRKAKAMPPLGKAPEDTSGRSPRRAWIWVKTALVLVFAILVVSGAFVMPHGSQGARDTYEGRPVASWVREALDYENWASTTNARYVVATRLKGRAVPCLVQELKSWCYPRWYCRVHEWQFRLPAALRVLPEPKEPRGAISAAAWVVSEMEDAGAPVYSQLAHCMQSANLHAWEFLDVMSVLIQAGPVAKGALPTLRQMAADKKGDWRVAAALAIYNTEGSTNALAEALRGELAIPDRFSYFEREIWWFRGDETVQDLLLPLICPIALDPSRSLGERRSVVGHLADLLTTNTLPRLTLEALSNSSLDPELDSHVHEALDRIKDAEQTPEHHSAAAR